MLPCAKLWLSGFQTKAIKKWNKLLLINFCLMGSCLIWQKTFFKGASIVRIVAPHYLEIIVLDQCFNEKPAAHEMFLFQMMLQFRTGMRAALFVEQILCFSSCLNRDKK